MSIKICIGKKKRKEKNELLRKSALVHKNIINFPFKNTTNFNKTNFIVEIKHKVKC